MGKTIYLKEKKIKSFGPKSSGKGFRVFKILILPVILSVALFFSINTAVRYAKESIDKKYDNFIIYCDEENYSQALGIYRDLYEKSKGSSIFSIDPDKRDAVLEKIENHINSNIREIFIKISTGKQPLNYKDIKLLEGFEEISVRKLSDEFKNYLTKLLYGEITPDDAKFTISELKKVNLNMSSVNLYETQIQDIADFSTNMNAISENKNLGNYLYAAELTSENLNESTGFVEEYLRLYLSDLKGEMYSVLIEEIDDMMIRHKYYTSRDYIERMLVFYPENNKLLQMLEICVENTQDDLVPYNLPVEHLSVRPLLSDQSFVFGLDGYASNAEDLLITSEEFSKILEQLYENNYILINAKTLVGSDGKRNTLMIPSGKKPLILSVEGLNYYASRQRTGNSISLSVDENGNILSTYKNKEGEYVTDTNGEATGILDSFVDKNPDFSFDGAKGIISLTGYECIYGYVVNNEQATARNLAYNEHLNKDFSITSEQIKANISEVEKISKALLKNGWIFASSTYNNYPVAENSLEMLMEDTSKWKSQVEIFTGEVNIFLFPHGSSVFPGDQRARYLVDEGFKIQSGIGPSAYFYHDGNYLFMDRVFLNGYTMRTSNLSRFFDVNEVYSQRRTKKR